MAMHSICSSNGLELHFTDDESYERFREDERKLFVKHYRETREKHGVWASNQYCFVPSASDLNTLDGRYMERLNAETSLEDVPLAIRNIKAAMDTAGLAQSQCNWGDNQWHRLEAVDDRLHEALGALGD